METWCETIGLSFTERGFEKWVFFLSSSSHLFWLNKRSWNFAKWDTRIIPAILQSRSKNVIEWMKWWNIETRFLDWFFRVPLLFVYDWRLLCVLKAVEKGATFGARPSLCAWSVLNYLRICAKDIRQIPSSGRCFLWSRREVFFGKNLDDSFSEGYESFQ